MIKRPRLAIDFEDWPQQDQEAWVVATTETGIFSQGGLAAHWRPKTKRQVQTGYSLWIGCLARHGRLNPTETPGERLTVDNLTLYRNELEGRVASCTVASRIRDLKETVRVMDPSADLALIRRLLSITTQKARPSRDKRSRMVPPRRLLAAGIERMQRIEIEHHVDTDVTACRYRDGLMVAMLATRSIMRLGCFTAMQLGRNIVKQGGVYVCHFDGADTKNGDDLDFHIPARLTPYIDTYLEQHRRLLLRGNASDVFWISRCHGPMREHSIRQRVRATTRQEVGVDIPPHMFRDCVATAMSEEDPEHIHIVPRLLHHRDEQSAGRSYNQADGISASRQMNVVLLELRRRALAMSPRRKRRRSRRRT